MCKPIPLVDQEVRKAQLKFSEQDLAKFVRLARVAGSGLGKRFHKAGSLESLYEALKAGCTVDQLATELRLLASIADPTYGSKANKFKAAVYFLERTSLTAYLRISVKPKESAALAYRKSAGDVTATCVWKEFTNAEGQKRLRADAPLDTLQPAAPTSIDKLDMTVEDYLLKNPQTTRLYLIHMGGYQNGMQQTYDGRSCTEHINSVLEVGAKLRMHLAILQDPSQNAATKSPTDAVFDGLKHQVGRYGADRVTVINAGTHHSGFGDPTFQAWVEDASVTAIVVMGFDADICAHANVFGSTQYVHSTAPLGTNAPPRLVPALLSEKDIVTSRPMLISLDTVRRPEWGPLQNT